MKKTVIISILAIMLISLGCSQVLSINISNKENNIYPSDIDIIHVDKNNTCGPWDGKMNSPYQTISEAIKVAKNGDIIEVAKGLYQEQIIVNKSIWIVGENKEETIIDAKYKEYAIKINSNDVLIHKFTIKNAGGYKGNAGIQINKDNCNISDCIIKRTRVGLLLDNTTNNIIENCKLYLNGKGIYTKLSKNIKIKNTEFCYCSIGISSKNSTNIEFKRCYIHECGTGLFFNVSSNVELSECAICDNNDNGGGCIMRKSNDFNFKNCNLLHNGFGILLKESDNLNVEKCDIQNISHYGISTDKKVGNIKINNSNLINNFRHAIATSGGNLQIRNSNLYNNKIDSANIKNSLCDARYNWWGSKLGPLFTRGFRVPLVLKRDSGRLKVFPWSLKPYEKAGSDWKVEDRVFKTIVKGYEDDPINFSGNDTDGDGLPDWWEEKYDYNKTSWDDHINIDNDGDGLNNFEECYADEWGATPAQKDIFLEFDWTPTKTQEASNTPPANYIQEMKQRFEEHGITLHVDTGNLNGGEEIPYTTDFNYDALTDLYWDYFLHNDLNNPRKNIFHYGLICDKGPGSGFAFVGWGHVNGFCISAGVLSSGNQYVPRGKLIATGSMHELGHTLGLFVDDFLGIDNHAATKPLLKEFWKCRNYKSCMNYRYTWSILDYSDGDNGRGDFDDWGNLEFDFFKNSHFEWPKS